MGSNQRIWYLFICTVPPGSLFYRNITQKHQIIHASLSRGSVDCWWRIGLIGYWMIVGVMRCKSALVLISLLVSLATIDYILISLPRFPSWRNIVLHVPGERGRKNVAMLHAWTPLVGSIISSMIWCLVIAFRLGPLSAIKSNAIAYHAKDKNGNGVCNLHPLPTAFK